MDSQLVAQDASTFNLAGKLVGLRTHELQDARKALAAAIRVKWTGILTKEPCDFGVPSLLAKLGDILQMGFQLHFIEESPPTLQILWAGLGWGSAAREPFTYRCPSKRLSSNNMHVR